MSAATYIVLAIVAAVVIAAAYFVIRDRLAGRNSCGCSCSECNACSSCGTSPITVTDDVDTDKKEEKE